MLCEVEGLRCVGENVGSYLLCSSPSCKRQHPKMRGRSKEGPDVEPPH
jgi:hypothetical protein